MAQIFKPNIDVIRQQAAAARESEQKRKDQYGDGEFRWLNLEDGDNVIRLLPPTNSRGLIFKKVCNHYFNDTPFAGKSKQRCPVQTHEEVQGTICPLCDIGDRIIAQRPDLKIRRWHTPGVAYFGNALSRTDSAQIPLACIARVTPAVKNWITQRLEEAWGQGIDLTDLDKGLDINIHKGETQTKRGKRTKYTPSIANLAGPTTVVLTMPQGTTFDQVKETIIESMYDLDDIWKYPSDEDIAESNKIASDIYSYYMKEAYSHPGASVQVPGVSAPESKPVAVTPQTVAQPPQPVQVAAEVEVAPGQTVPQGAEVVPVQPATVPVTAQAVAQQVVAVATQVPTQAALPIQAATEAAPTDKPSCWGGAGPKEDGSTGYDDESEQCLMCAHDMTCGDACTGAA